MIESAEVYLRRAEQCDQAAAKAKDQMVRTAFLMMARQLREMADIAEVPAGHRAEARDTAYE